MPPRLASCSIDSFIIIWDPISGVQLAKLAGHEGGVLAIRWSLLEKNILLSGGYDMLVRAWQTSELAIYAEKPNEAASIVQVFPSCGLQLKFSGGCRRVIA